MFIRIPSEIAEIFCRKPIRLPWLNSTISPSRLAALGGIFRAVGSLPRYLLKSIPVSSPTLQRGAGEVRVPVSFVLLDLGTLGFRSI